MDRERGKDECSVVESEMKNKIHPRLEQITSHENGEKARMNMIREMIPKSVLRADFRRVPLNFPTGRM